MAEERMLNDEILLGLIKANSGGGGGGTTDYSDLSNKPQINNVTLSGNKSASDLGLVASVEGKGLSENDYTDADKAIVGGVTAALAGKQDVFTSGDYLEMANGVLNVTKNKGNDLYSYKFITTSTSDWPRVKIQRYINGVFQSEETYNNDDVRTNPVTLDGLFTFTYGVDGYRWQYTLLANSHQHNTGEVVKWMYNVSVDSTESFDVVPQDTSKNLVLQEDLDAAISSAYHHAGTKTCAELVAGLLVAGNEGNVYNMTDSGTTTADFIEGAGQPIKAGDNVGIAKISDGVYKFDLLSGFVDTTNFVQKSVTAGLLKNDGTVDTTIQGDVSTLKSGLTTLSDEVNGDATTYDFADVVTIEDAVPSNLADCSVKIEPVQDLHGQSAPYVGGAGKNKLPMTVDGIKALNTYGTWSGNDYTIKGGTVTILTDADGNVVGVKANGTFTDQVVFTICQNINFPAGSYKYGCASSSLSNDNRIRYNDGTFFAVISSDVTKTYDNDFELFSAAVVVEAGTVSNLIFQPMVYLASEQDATFAPYTNYCPISGHTEASVQRTGKNFIPMTVAGIKALNTSGTWSGNVYTYNGVDFTLATNDEGAITKVVADKTASATTVFYLGYIPTFAEGTEIIISGTTVANNQNYVRISRTGGTNVADTTTTGVEYTIPDSNGGFYANIRIGNGQTVSKLEFYPMVRLATVTDATFEPYQGNTYTIALGDTIYGGTVDFDSGVMTVTRVKTTVDDLEWTKYNVDQGTLFRGALSNIKQVADGYELTSAISSAYPAVANNDRTDKTLSQGPGISAVDIIDDDYADAASFKTAMSDVEICYELATPTTIQLTPQQIQLLKGQNTLTASTGQISVTVNGVSGAIGSVQSEVNELAEDVAEIATKSYFTKTAPNTGWSATDINLNDYSNKMLSLSCLINKERYSIVIPVLAVGVETSAIGIKLGFSVNENVAFAKTNTGLLTFYVGSDNSSIDFIITIF